MLAFLFGDVFRNAEQVAGTSLLICDREFFRMKNPPSSIFRLDRLFWNIYEIATREDFPVLTRKEIGFRLRKDVIIIVPQQLMARVPEQVLAGAIEANEPQIFGVLDKNHVRNVLKN